MKILLDTNVLISAFVFGGKAGQLLEKLFDSDFELLVSDYVNKKFHDKLNENGRTRLQRLLSDAMTHKVDVILTGDRDFLEANLDYPQIFSPTMMLEYLNSIGI